VALEPIDTEDFVIEYVGEVIRRQVFLFLYYGFLGYFVIFNEIRISKFSLESLLVDVPTSHLCFILSLVLFEKHCCMFFLSIIMRTAFPLEHCISEPFFCSTKFKLAIHEAQRCGFLSQVITSRKEL